MVSTDPGTSQSIHTPLLQPAGYNKLFFIPQLLRYKVLLANVSLRRKAPRKAWIAGCLEKGDFLPRAFRFQKINLFIKQLKNAKGA